jgi:protein involved in polysaccharide export with SLBB domain
VVLCAFSQADASSEYLLGPGDKLSIVLLDSDLTFEATVLADGSITLPYAGRINCAGRTLKEVADEARERFSREISNPRVVISIGEPRVRYVYTLGSGLTSTQTALLPEWRVSHLLAATGGLRARPNLLVGWLRRRAGEVLPINLSSLLLTDRRDVDPLLEEGDVLVVERIDTAGVYVSGNVVAPGAYALSIGAGAARAILRAGGIAPGADVKHVVIWRADRSRVEADLSEALFYNNFAKDVALQPGDVVVVPSTAPSKVAVTLAGAVARPGYYSLEEGRARTVADFLELAGGLLTPNVSISLLRSIDGRPTKVDLPRETLLAQPAHEGDIILVTAQTGSEGR